MNFVLTPHLVTDPKERHWQSLTFDAHDKGPGHERRYPLYAGENFRFRLNPLKDFVYCTQFLQAEAMSYAYNHWRREFRGPGKLSYHRPKHAKQKN